MLNYYATGFFFLRCLKTQSSTWTVELAGCSHAHLPPCHLRTSLAASAAVVGSADMSSANTLLCVLKVVALGLIYTDCDQGCEALSFFTATGCTPWLTSRWSEKERCVVSLSLQLPSYPKGGVWCARIFIFVPHHSYRPDRKGCPPVMMR